MADIGRLGEDLAAAYLESAGFRVLSRNWRVGRHEIDLVIRDRDTVAFVEVKTRRGGPQDPVEAVDRAKRRHLRTAAEQWIVQHAIPASEYRFDVIGVMLTRAGRPRIRHISGAFTGDDG